MLFLPALILFLYTNVLMADPGDDSVFLVDQETTSDEKRLPNAHSAALVMGLILLCVLAYGAYRLYLSKCGTKQSPLTVTVEDKSDFQDLEKYRKEREAYLAIYGPKNTVNSISSAVSIEQKVF